MALPIKPPATPPTAAPPRLWDAKPPTAAPEPAPRMVSVEVSPLQAAVAGKLFNVSSATPANSARRVISASCFLGCRTLSAATATAVSALVWKRVLPAAVPAGTGHHRGKELPFKVPGDPGATGYAPPC